MELVFSMLCIESEARTGRLDTPMDPVESLHLYQWK